MLPPPGERRERLPRPPPVLAAGGSGRTGTSCGSKKSTKARRLAEQIHREGAVVELGDAARHDLTRRERMTLARPCALEEAREHTPLAFLGRTARGRSPAGWPSPSLAWAPSARVDRPSCDGDARRFFFAGSAPAALCLGSSSGAPPSASSPSSSPSSPCGCSAVDAAAFRRCGSAGWG